MSIVTKYGWDHSESLETIQGRPITETNTDNDKLKTQKSNAGSDMVARSTPHAPRRKAFWASFVPFMIFIFSCNKISMLVETSKQIGGFQEEPTMPIQHGMLVKHAVFDGIYSRAFPEWNSTIPCYQPEKLWKNEATNKVPTKQGLLMTKCVKSGSTTAASVQIRIAHQVAKARNKEISRTKMNSTSNGGSLKNMQEFPLCRIRYVHETSSAMDFRNRSKLESFLWTIIRDPTRRAISHFFFEKISRRKEEPYDSNFQEYVLRPHNAHHFLYFLALDEYDPAKIPRDIERDTQVANRIIQEYDFIGLVERMDESIVALQLLLGLETRDVLHLDSKASGTFDAGGSPGGCTYIVPSFLSNEMKDFFYNASHPAGWTRVVAVETALHRAVNASLDMTIQKLGRRRFERALAAFRKAQQVVKRECDSPDAFPCSTSGGKHARKGLCAISDMGCGTKCIDQVADQLGLPEYEYRLN